MPYRSSNRLADLLMRQGEIAAQRELGRGQAWSGAIQNIGQIAANTLGAYQQHQQDAPRREAATLELKGLKEQDAARTQMKQENAAIGKLLQESLTTVNGRQTVDRAKFMEGVQANNLGHRVDIFEMLDKIDPPESPDLKFQKEKFAAEQADRARTADRQAAQDRQIGNMQGVRRMIGESVAARSGPLTPQDRQQYAGMALQEGVELPESVMGDPTPPNPTEASLAAAAAAGDKNAAEALRLLRAQSPGPQGPQPGWQWVDRGGKEVYTNQTQPGDKPLRAPSNTGDTAQDRQRNARTQAARDFLGRLNELRTKINTRMGPAAGAAGYARRAGASLGMDPDVAEYERIRAAGGRALAVAIMGAQNLSDADASAWSNMLPDARTDEETAGRLTAQVETMLDGMTGTTSDKPGARTPNLSGLSEGKKRRFTNGPFKGQEWAIVNGQAKRVK